MHGCCSKVHIVTSVRIIEIDKHQFQVKIDYCNNCSSVKTTSNIRAVKNDHKTKY